MIRRELADMDMCHCPIETPCVTNNGAQQRGTFVYKYLCGRCLKDATVRIAANLQAKEARKHPPKTKPGWEDTYYRASKDPTEPDYPLPKDPHLANGLFRLDGKKSLPCSPFKDLSGRVCADGKPTMTIRCVTTRARFAPYVARPGRGGPGAVGTTGASSVAESERAKWAARREPKLLKMSP